MRQPATLAHRVRTWWHNRLPRTDTLRLTQRNIYILPTRAGVMFAITLLVLLVASINYQLNLGYILTFLLAGSGLVSMHLTHNTLRGLTLHLRPPGAVFAADAVPLDVTLTSEGAARFGVGLRVLDANAAGVAWSDVPAGGQTGTQVRFVPSVRGRHPLPTLQIETRFPLGLFRAWSVWRPATDVLVYPRAEEPAPALPGLRATAGGSHQAIAARTLGTDIEGIRAYRRGDPLKLIAWKKAARTLETSGELVSRDTSAIAHQQLWLDWEQAAPLDPERRLSRLTAWVLQADRAGASFGLHLPGKQLTPAAGDAQRHRCLEALALWR